MNEWIEHTLTILTGLVSIGAGIFSFITLRNTRNKNYKEFVEKRENRKKDEKN